MYDREIGEVRTSKVNSLFAMNPHLEGFSGANKKGTSPFLAAKSLSAERVGFEPTVPVSRYGNLANCSFRPLRHLSFNVPKIKKIILETMSLNMRGIVYAEKFLSYILIFILFSRSLTDSENLKSVSIHNRMQNQS